jgi:hypothetical protein
MATLVARSASAGPVSDWAAATSVSLLGTAHVCLIVGDIGVGGKGFETEKWEWRAGVPAAGTQKPSVRKFVVAPGAVHDCALRPQSRSIDCWKCLPA